MIEFVAETGSTNADLAARLAAREPLAEGLWLVADRQVAGRGRGGRTWFDGGGNFMGSTVVRRAPGDPPAFSLALVAGLAVHGVVTERLGDGAAMLKWPNDVMVDGAKLAGILLEAVGDVVVVGIGVNLAVAPDVPGRRTVALADLCGAIDRDGFARTLAENFALEVGRWRDFGLDPILRRWQTAAHPEGARLDVEEPGGGSVLTGAFAGLTDDGALRLRLADGSTRVIHAGEVRLAGSN